MKYIIPTAILALAVSGCSGSSNPAPTCGDDAINQESEQCDKSRLGNVRCSDLGYTGGELGCTDDCKFDTSLCVNVPPDCNDGDIDQGEDCDGVDLNDTTCADLGFLGGQLACGDDCLFDTSACQPDPCGNETLDTGEQCDGPELDDWLCQDFGFGGGQLSCDEDCRLDATACSGCNDDGQEPNDDMAGAAPLAVGNHDLMMCSTAGQEDWFTIDLTAGQRIFAELSQAGAEADLDIELLDSNGLIVANSGQLGLSEQVDYTSTEGGSLYLRVFVYGMAPGAVAYQLLVVIDPECIEHVECLLPGQVCQDRACVDFSCSADQPCPDDLVCDGGSCVECATAADCPEPDAYLCQQNACVYSCQDDSFEPNSTLDDAADLSVGVTQTGLTLCGDGDEDWFAVDLAELHRYELGLAFSNSQGDIDVEVYQASDDDVPVAVGYSNDDDEHVTIAVEGGAAGSYLIRVRQPAGDLAQSYSLSLTDEGAVSCAWDSDCNEGDICLDFACVTPECTEDTDCSAPERCVVNSCVGKPPGDICSEAIVADSFPFNDEQVDMAPHRDAVNFEPGSCTEWGTAGNDVIYRVDLLAGQQIWATLTADFDAALLLTSECSATPAADACLDGADENFAAGEEQAYWQADADTTVYVVVDTPAPLYPPQGIYSLLIEVE